MILATSAFASTNDVDLLIEKNPKIINDFSYTSTLNFKKKVKVAVIGDFVHPEEFESIHPNLLEIQGNGIDDDQNGYIDDFYGYDMHSESGELNNPVISGHENGIVSIMDAIVSKYRLADYVSIIPINIYSYDGRFDDFRFKKLADAIDYAVVRGAKVISISQGISINNRYSFQFIDNDYSKSLAYLQSAINRATEKGSIVVGSVSNESSRDHVVDPSVPGNLDNVLSVANVNFDGVIKSGYGNNVDIAYYGTDIFVWDGRCYDRIRQLAWACKDLDGKNSFEYVTGSSLSTPIVALSLGILSAAGAEVVADKKLETVIQRSCSKKITTKRNIKSRCIYSPTKLAGEYLK